VAGAVLGSAEAIEKVRFFARHTGPALSPFHSWLLSKSLETLAVRMDRHCDNALRLAEWLEQQPEVEWVKYPFLTSYANRHIAQKQMRQGGGLVTFQLQGGIARGRRFLDSLAMLSMTANLGDTRTIATHPASTTHSKLSEEDKAAVGITDGMVRISLGLEHIEDITEDIAQAMAASKDGSLHE
jgi:O-succinylhomoserine sulfhydrylase